MRIDGRQWCGLRIGRTDGLTGGGNTIDDTGVVVGDVEVAGGVEKEVDGAAGDGIRGFCLGREPAGKKV